MLKPNLDRFSQPGPNERPIGGIKSLLDVASCEVCGQDVHPRDLHAWNDREVCKYCIEEMTEEVGIG